MSSKQFPYGVHGGPLGARIFYPDDVVEDGALAVDGAQYWRGATRTTDGTRIYGEYSGPSKLDDWDGIGAPAPLAAPMLLTKIQFARLVMSAGGMSDAQLVAARNDENLAAFWILIDLASNEVKQDDPDVQRGLQALDALGYLPHGAQAVFDNWPASS